MKTAKQNRKRGDKMNYLIIEYLDVRRNEEGSWDILELKNIGKLEIKEGTSDKELIDALKDYGYLNEKANTNTIEVWRDKDITIFYNRKTGEPLGEIKEID
ncbi:hypothetical protein LIP24_09975 [Collinsella aerofaciens]|nr:hypothetical protein [Collinsella aerofaciens]MCB5366965.1 hypothetical protein [Collinsella aerofaciens]